MLLRVGQNIFIQIHILHSNDITISRLPLQSEITTLQVTIQLMLQMLE